MHLLDMHACTCRMHMLHCLIPHTCPAANLGMALVIAYEYIRINLEECLQFRWLKCLWGYPLTVTLELIKTSNRQAIILALFTYSRSSRPRGWPGCRREVPMLIVVHELHTIAIKHAKAPGFAFSTVAKTNLRSNQCGCDNLPQLTVLTFIHMCEQIIRYIFACVCWTAFCM